MIFLIYTLL